MVVEVVVGGGGLDGLRGGGGFWVVVEVVVGGGGLDGLLGGGELEVVGGPI